jgi:bisphosphoglycerate-dependent phosphoglycerate mutase
LYFKLKLAREQTEKSVVLNERRYTDDQGEKKKEVLTVVLDYANCKWRKVKRTQRDK